MQREFKVSIWGRAMVMLIAGAFCVLVMMQFFNANTVSPIFLLSVLAIMVCWALNQFKRKIIVTDETISRINHSKNRNTT